MQDLVCAHSSDIILRLSCAYLVLPRMGHSGTSRTHGTERTTNTTGVTLASRRKVGSLFVGVNDTLVAQRFLGSGNALLLGSSALGGGLLALNLGYK
jgi:hypothetical protein